MTTLAEELHLLSLDERGVKTCFADLNTGSVAASLLDLALADRIAVVDKNVVVTSLSPVGHPLLDELLTEIASDKPRTPWSWNNKLYWPMSTRVMDAMVQRGLLRHEQRKVIGLIPSSRYPAARPAERKQIQRLMASAVITGQATDAHTAALAGLLHALHMEGQVLPDHPHTAARRSLKTIAESAWTPDPGVQATKTAVISLITSSIVAGALAATSN